MTQFIPIFGAEPKIHSHITDCLPETDPLAFQTVYCRACGEMVHCENNETMSTWVETGAGSYCLGCFAATEDSFCLDGKFAL